jgi:CHAT domain-containing protein/tetratricopeptide (TPR) repeat protein
MTLSNEDEIKIRAYLVGGLGEAEELELEQRLLGERDLVEHLLLIEDELIEDYERGALDATERERFETFFLVTPARRRKLKMVRAARRYAAGTVPAPAAGRRARSARPGWWQRLLRALFYPQWKKVAFACVVAAAIVFGVWRVLVRESPVEEGLAALNEAFASRRPIEARVTGLRHAPYAATRGADPRAGNYRAYDLAAALLLKAAHDSPTPSALHALGRFYLMRQEFDRAIQQFEEALKATPDDAGLHADLGAALFEQGKLERLSQRSGQSEVTLAKSLQHLTRALTLDESLPEARFNRALLYEELKLPERAREDWEQYLSRDSDPRSPWAAEARRHLDQLRERRDQSSRREENLFREFLEAYRGGDEERAWQNFSRGHYRTGNFVTGRVVDDYLRLMEEGRGGEAQDLLRAMVFLGQLSERRAGDRFTSDLVRLHASLGRDGRGLVARARKLMADAYATYNQSKNDRAVEMYAEARSLFRRAGDLPEAMFADYWIGHCHFQRADTKRGLSIFTALAALCRQRGYVWLEALARGGLANVCSRERRYSAAVEHARDAYRLSAQGGDDNGMLRDLSALASFYRNLGSYGQSLWFVRQGLEVASRVSADASQTTGLYATAAWDFTALGHYTAALEFEREALNLGEAMNQPLTVSRYYVQMGLIHARLKNFDEAASSIWRGLELGRGLGREQTGNEMMTYARLHLAHVQRESGRFADALATLEQVIAFCRPRNEAWLLHEAHKERLLTHIARGEIRLAREALREVLAGYEEQRGKILEEGNRNAFFAMEQDVYDIAADFAGTHLHDARQSFDYSESSRGRSLLDATTTEWRLRDDGVAPDLRFPGTSAPRPLKEIEAALPANAQLIMYAALSDKLLVWYVSRERFESQVVPLGAEALAEKVDRLLRLISAPPRAAAAPPPPVSAELYELLIRPVLPFIDGGKQLCIVPDKSLHLLPFGVLVSPDTSRYVAEDYALVYAASASMFVRDTELALRAAGGGAERLLAVGNPHFDREAFPDFEYLPAAAGEAAQVAGLYGATPLNGADASEGVVTAEMRRANVIHLATHYVPDPTSAMLSKLLLAAPREGARRDPKDDGALLAHEIYRLRLPLSRLVVLSACQTGVEDYLKGEGAIGLVRPFKAAGVPLVVASLWGVDSQATSALMVDFHRLRKLERVPVAEALRRAQVRMIRHREPDYRHPYYWAAFTLIGGYSDY